MRKFLNKTVVALKASRYNAVFAFGLIAGTAIGIIMIAEATTSISIQLPEWFYQYFCVAFSIFTVAFVAFVFYTGVKWSRIQEICKEFPKIRRALDLMSQSMLSHKWVKEQIYVSSGSPLQLTEAGKKMLKDSNFEEFYTANKDHLFSYITSQAPKSPAEVEATAKDAMFYLDPKTTPKMQLIENYGYNNGKPTADILFAYSIEIRDRYLKDHPEIK